MPSTKPRPRATVTIAQLQVDVLAQARTLGELVATEARRADQETHRAEVSALKEEQLNERLDRIEARIGAIYSLGKWVLLSGGSTLLLAVVTFILKGGLFA